MKLKQLFEAGSGYSRDVYARDNQAEPEYNEGPADTKATISFPYTLSTENHVLLTVDVVYQDWNDDIELHSAVPVSVKLPSGREVEIDVARQQLSGEDGDEFAPPEVFAATQEYLEQQMHRKVAYKEPEAQAQFSKHEPAVAPNRVATTV